MAVIKELLSKVPDEMVGAVRNTFNLRFKDKPNYDELQDAIMVVYKKNIQFGKNFSVLKHRFEWTLKMP